MTNLEVQGQNGPLRQDLTACLVMLETFRAGHTRTETSHDRYHQRGHRAAGRRPRPDPDGLRRDATRRTDGLGTAEGPRRREGRAPRTSTTSPSAPTTPWSTCALSRAL